MDKAALYKLTYGMYIVSSKDGDRINGQIANTVFQVTSEPPKIAVCLNKQNLTHEIVSSSKKFSVSVLSMETPMTFIGKFGFKSGRDTDKFEGTGLRQGSGQGARTSASSVEPVQGPGSPVVLDYAVGYIDAKVVSSCDVGSHTLFIGEIIDSEVLSDKEPMTYAYYHECMKGKSPKTAPTYIQEEQK